MKTRVEIIRVFEEMLEKDLDKLVGYEYLYWNIDTKVSKKGYSGMRYYLKKYSLTFSEYWFWRDILLGYK